MVPRNANDGCEPPEIPREETIEAMGFERKPMVNWFSPVRLLSIAVRVVISMLFGNYADKREIQAALKKPSLFKYDDNDEIWIDYIADIGDGFDSTYTLAKLLAEPQLSPKYNNDSEYETERGRLLIMGGDEIYPSASRDEYRNRTEGPYRAALPWVEDHNHPHLFVLPGNHDWYDGLTSFTRLFCQERWIGGWKTQQSSSYFAIQLPHNWWLFAIDIQLSADIDKPQLDYFDDVISTMSSGDKVIFATASPSWVTDSMSGATEHDNIQFMENRIRQKEAEIYVNIAGDLHHYARYTNENDSKQYITAGGGGAFLHGTHMLPQDIDVAEHSATRTYSRSEDGLFPCAKISKKLLKGNFKFCYRNWKMCLFFGFLSLITCWVTQSASISLGQNFLVTLSQIPFQPGMICDTYTAYLKVLIHSPASCFFFVFYIAGLIIFCQPFPDKNKTKQLVKQIILGALHGFIQISFVLGLTLSFVKLNIWAGLTVDTAAHTAALIFEIVTAGSFLAGFMMGVYLYFCNYLFYFHAEAAFSSSSIADYKNFIRFHINREGDLTIYPMGVRTVERDWKLNSEGKPGDSWFVPTSGKGIHEYVHLIERPITVKTR